MVESAGRGEGVRNPGERGVPKREVVVSLPPETEIKGGGTFQLPNLPPGKHHYCGMRIGTQLPMSPSRRQTKDVKLNLRPKRTDNAQRRERNLSAGFCWESVVSSSSSNQRGNHGEILCDHIS